MKLNKDDFVTKQIPKMPEPIITETGSGEFWPWVIVTVGSTLAFVLFLLWLGGVW